MSPEDYEILFGEPMPSASTTPEPNVSPPVQDALPPRPQPVVQPRVIAPPPRLPSPPVQFSVGRPEPVVAAPLQPSRNRPAGSFVLSVAFALPLVFAMGWLIVASFAAANGNGESVVVETEVAGRAIVSASEPNVATTAVAAATPTTEATTVPSTTTAQSTFAVVGNDEFGRARRQLAAATVVAQFVDFSDYDRDTYDGSGWPDADGDCQSDRHEILIEESLVEVTFDADGCRVETGLWLDPYDGTEYTSAEQVSIDHVIPLAAAHRAGAWQWDQPSRRAFAFDITFPATHAVVGSGVNQAKADRGPEDWRPPAEEAWCRYAVDWTAVKDRWSLAFTNAEVLALGEMLDTCEPVEQIAAIGGDGAIGATTPTAVDVTPTTSTTSSTTTSTSTTAPTTTLPPATAAPTSVVVVTQAPDLDCHPNYLPCIPNRPGDALNCGDIGRRVSVIGGDPYRLDLDNDGFGCDASG